MAERPGIFVWRYEHATRIALKQEGLTRFHRESLSEAAISD